MKAIIHNCICNLDSFTEDIVQVSTKNVGYSTFAFSMRELKAVKHSILFVNMIAEFITHTIKEASPSHLTISLMIMLTFFALSI